jgi:hypothetical protein
MFVIKQEDIDGWHKKAYDAMFYLIKTKGDGFSADDLNALFRYYDFPPDVIKKWSGKLFRQFVSAGYIEKTNKYLLNRNSAPIPIWIATSAKAEEHENKSPDPSKENINQEIAGL